MAYKIGRAQQITETLELVDSQGKTVKEIPVELDVDKVAVEFNRRYNAVLRAEKAAKTLPKAKAGEALSMTESEAQAANDALETAKDAIIGLFELVFGEAGTRELLDFFGGKYFEMAVEVTPFIAGAVIPAMKEAAQQQQARLANNYKLSAAHAHRLNRSQRRALGL